jgi:hypothetical protein
MTDAKGYFSHKEAILTETSGRLQKYVLRLSWARFIFFLIFLVAVVYFANDRNTSGIFISIFIFPVAFGFLVREFNKLSNKLRFLNDLHALYTAELKRSDLDLKGLDGGQEFADRSHYYSYDLDLFGEHSLFSLINRASTPDGRTKMSQWMLRPAQSDEIAVRQAAVKELAESPDWFMSFLASGVSASATSDSTEKLKAWLEDPNDSKTPLIKTIVSFISPFLIIVGLAAIIWFGFSIYVLAPMLILNGIVLIRVQEKVRLLNERTSGNVRLLRTYESMITQLADATFSSNRLNDLQKPFKYGANNSIRSLRRLLDYLDGRSNMFYSIFNLIFLIDIHLIKQLELWKSNNKEDLVLWFDNMAEMEVFSSLGAHAFLHSDHCMPVIGEDWTIKTSSIGHPLIPSAECVRNDFESQGRGTVNIITGSNMSGKSTFLRTVGINVVLGLMGSVVSAKTMQIPVVQVFTGMRSEDDLSSHISSFYAELRRIRFLLNTIETSEIPVLYMLDEILKGTNTKDRHRGSEGLVSQLADTDSFGFISTHDLSIGKLADADKRIRNFSFNSTIKGDEIIFDYKITKGVCHSFNASKLMEKMGIRVAD